MALITIVFFGSTFGVGNLYAQNQVKLTSGTNVRVEVVNTISSEGASVGQQVRLRVANDVKVDGEVVIKAGAPAWGKVVNAEGNGMLGKPGKIGITLTNVKTVDGQKVPISAKKVVKGESKQTIAIVVTLVLCLLGIFIKGKDATLQSGSYIDAQTAGEANIAI